MKSLPALMPSFAILGAAVIGLSAPAALAQSTSAAPMQVHAMAARPALNLSAHGEVKVAPDIKTATVYVSFVGTRGQRSAAEEKLSANGKRIQALLGPNLSMKWTPVLTFLLDDSIEKGNRVLAILDELEREQKPRT
jgi:ribosome-binding factor A